MWHVRHAAEYPGLELTCMMHRAPASIFRIEALRDIVRCGVFISGHEGSEIVQSPVAARHNIIIYM